VACYLGKAKNPNASILEMLEPFTHKFCGRAKKRLGVRVVFRFDFEGASPALSIIGQFDRLAFDGCINRFSRLGSLTAAAINKSKGSIVGPICDDLSPICDELKASIPLTNRPGFRRYSVTAEITGSNPI
jgi:hypothetical protein